MGGSCGWGRGAGVGPIEASSGGGQAGAQRAGLRRAQGPAAEASLLTVPPEPFAASAASVWRVGLALWSTGPDRGIKHPPASDHGSSHLDPISGVVPHSHVAFYGSLHLSGLSFSCVKQLGWRNMVSEVP